MEVKLKFELVFEFEKETKGTFRFKERGDDPVVGTLYVKKGKMGVPRPNRLAVTIEDA